MCSRGFLSRRKCHEIKKKKILSWIFFTVPMPERGLTISLAVWIQYTNMTDGQTARHWSDRTTAKTALTHSVAR